MIGLDTNVLLRYLVDDDEEHHRRASRLIEGALSRGEELFVPKIVLCETVWVLERSYGVSLQQVAEVVDRLLHARSFVLEDRDQVRGAHERLLRGEAGFTDLLIVESAVAAGCKGVATFERKLLRQAEGIEP